MGHLTEKGSKSWGPERMRKVNTTQSNQEPKLQSERNSVIVRFFFFGGINPHDFKSYIDMDIIFTTNYSLMKTFFYNFMNI